MRPSLPVALLASVLCPIAALASPPASADASSTPYRVTTGVVAPHVLNSRDIKISNEGLQSETAVMPEVGLTLDVDEKGVPGNLRVVKSVNPKLDAQVLTAARGFRFRPAMLDHQAVPMSLRLNVLIQR